MRRKIIAKKLGMIAFACLLAMPCTGPMLCLADAPASASGAQGQESQTQEGETVGLKMAQKAYSKAYKTEEGRLYKEISFEYPVAEGNSEAAQTFNKFYANLLSKWKKEAKANLEEAKELVLLLEDPDRYYFSQVTCEVTNEDENYVSVLQVGYDYELGAHGMPYRYSYIFDAKTGKKVSAANLLGISKNQLNRKVRSLYLKKFDKEQDTEDPVFFSNRAEVKAALDQVDFNQNLYYLQNGKVCFYVYPYVVGPYASGFIEVAVKL